MPERVDPVRVVEVGVDAEDLTEAGTDIVEESFGEASALAKPLASSQSGQRSLEVGGISSNWLLVRRSI